MRRNVNVCFATTWLALMILAGCGDVQVSIAAAPAPPTVPASTPLPVQAALPVRAAVAFLEQKGYRVQSYEGTVETYQLTKARLLTMPYMIYWGLQTVDPMLYLGKTVEVEKYIVTNHPLDSWTASGKPAAGAGKTAVFVFLIENQPIGGTSYPVTDAPLAGGYWSLDGRTLEEVQGTSYQAWLEAWNKRFQE
jgi:hypothetical protein